MNNDLISREALKNSLLDSHPDDLQPSDMNFDTGDIKIWLSFVLKIIDQVPKVEPLEKIGAICNENCGYNPQGEYVDVSKLRLMKVEECAGHTIDYAMGWKACIEWIKGGAK